MQKKVGGVFFLFSKVLNQNHYIEQTGEYDNPELIERIAMGLKSDSYVPGMMEAQIEIDSRSRLSSSLTVHGDTAEVPYENIKNDPKVKEALRNIPVAVQSQLETVDSMEAKEKERTIALDQRAELDIYSYNKAQKYPTLQNKALFVQINLSKNLLSNLQSCINNEGGTSQYPDCRPGSHDVIGNYFRLWSAL